MFYRTGSPHARPVFFTLHPQAATCIRMPRFQRPVTLYQISHSLVYIASFNIIYKPTSLFFNRFFTVYFLVFFLD